MLLGIITFFGILIGSLIFSILSIWIDGAGDKVIAMIDKKSLTN